jgi:lipopolysaccharide transport system permease protein
LGGIPDFGIGFVVLIGLMAYYRLPPTSGIIFLPFLLLLTVATALAVGLWLAVLNVEYRDVRFTVPFLIQFWFFITPVAYSSTLIPEPWRPFLGLNPMTGVVEGFRSALFGTSIGSQELVLLSILVVIVLLAGGLIYFRQMEGRFADIV